LPGPLTGIRILDLTTVLMGPYATLMLGDMGADVIKIEPPQGDMVRKIGPARNPGMGTMFLQTNRSKRSLVLDLKQPAAREALLSLAKTADALVYNVRPQAMARLGLAYEDVAAVNPGIVYAGLFGYRQDGPYAANPAYDDLIQGSVSLPSIMQRAGAQTPRYIPCNVADRSVGLAAVGVILAALLHRQRTGEGQRVDVPMFETMTHFVMGDHMGGMSFEPPLGPPGYERLLAPARRPYPTQDGFVCVLIYTDVQWRNFFRAMGREAVLDADPRFASIASRTRHINELYGELAEIIATRTTGEWLALFGELDIPAMPLHTPESLIEDRHLAATGFFEVVEHPSEGQIRQMQLPSVWSGSVPNPDRPAPRLGEHSAEVLGEAGLSATEIAALAATGATHLAETESA
jgi:crotonobetainyl-CoA:carnitine CoA-transferase CaiB-like acyl-CoA transferase